MEWMERKWTKPTAAAAAKIWVFFRLWMCNNDNVRTILLCFCFLFFYILRICMFDTRPCNRNNSNNNSGDGWWLRYRFRTVRNTYQNEFLFLFFSFRIDVVTHFILDRVDDFVFVFVSPHDLCKLPSIERETERKSSIADNYKQINCRAACAIVSAKTITTSNS